VKTYTFGKLEIQPANNPGVLGTATWDVSAASAAAEGLGKVFWSHAKEALKAGVALPQNDLCKLFPSSAGRLTDNWLVLALLSDGQHLLAEFAQPGAIGEFGQGFSRLSLGQQGQVALHEADVAAVTRFVRKLHPQRGPRALGTTGRLGIGSGLTTAAWPAVWRAMEEANFATNAIQSSCREIHRLTDVLTAHTAQTGPQTDRQPTEQHHTGATFEGVYLAGLLEALKHSDEQPYGAGVEHLQAMPGPQGLAQARAVLEATPQYTFFAVDVAPLLDCVAMHTASRAAAATYLAKYIPDPTDRREILSYHTTRQRLGSCLYPATDETVGRLVGKYFPALDALERVVRHLESLRGTIQYDLEMSMNDTPPNVQPWKCVTQDVELMFLLLEAQRRRIGLTHIGPHLGIEPGVDYRCPAGLAGLEQRLAKLGRIACDSQVMLSCHGGDCLSRTTRRVIGKATAGRVHFKISQALWQLFAETLWQIEPLRFSQWWQATLSHARRLAQHGSPLARQSLLQYQATSKQQPTPCQPLFRHFCLAPLGQRDAAGRFAHRHLLYEASPEFFAQYQRRLARLLEEIADDVFDRTR